MPNPKPIALWLFTCCGMIFVMALLGAITRLTESGLSITDWAPVTGAMPPLDQAAWHKAFRAYQDIPQYKLLHHGMTLDEFKNIYFWEWLHRLWGRLIGFVFALPLLYFFLKKQISQTLGARLLGILMLGGLQGFIGWFMVQSGLTDNTSVSPYRLALHLGFALFIYSLLLWTALNLRNEGTSPSPLEGEGLGWGVKHAPRSRFKALKQHGWIALTLLAITIIWGAFTAGLHAGEAYNTWPLMEGEFFPAAALTILPKWHNAFENLALVQFIHRWIGPLTALVILSWIYRLWRAEINRGWALALGGMALLQVALGITTLLTHAAIIIAVTHQAGAIMLLTLLLVNLQRLTPPRAQ